MTDEEKNAVAVVEGIAELNASLRDMGPQAAIEYLALQVVNHRNALLSHDEKFVTLAQLKNVLKLIAGSIARNDAALRERFAKMEAAPGSHGGGVTIRAGSVSVDGMEQVADMMARLDSTLRAPVRPIYGKDGVLIGAQRDALPGEEPAARALKPRLKYNEWARIDGFHQKRDAR